MVFLKRLVLMLSVLFGFVGSASGLDARVTLEVNVFQGFRSRVTESPSPGSIVYLPPDPGWSDGVERQRAQIADSLGLDGVTVLLVRRVVSGYDLTQTIVAQSVVYSAEQGGTTTEQSVEVSVRPVRTGDRAVRLDLRLRLGAQEIAAASVSGELGRTFILGGKPETSPIFIAVTPRDAGHPLAPPEAFTPGEEIQRPKLVTRVDPRYPEALHRDKKSGMVVIQAIVNADGSVGLATVVRHSDPEFDESALEAVRQWRYEPAVLKGKPAPVYLTITVSFRM